jgi:hypothetical protein
MPGCCQNETLLIAISPGSDRPQPPGIGRYLHIGPTVRELDLFRIDFSPLRHAALLIGIGRDRLKERVCLCHGGAAPGSPFRNRTVSRGLLPRVRARF